MSLTRRTLLRNLACSFGASSCSGMLPLLALPVPKNGGWTAEWDMALLKAEFGDDFLHHVEWMKNGAGVVFPAAIPVVRFTTEERLNAMIDFCRAHGVGVANPHVNHVEGGGRYREDNVQLLAKYRNDAKGLMNPGKMKSFEKQSVDR